MEGNKKVAIIILNWNAYQDTFECLESLHHLNYTNFTVFLVDNDSLDNSFNMLQDDYNVGKFKLNITFIQTGSNLGFAGGNNVGIKAAYEQGFDYFWLLNNDTIVEKDALGSLVNVIETDQRIGIVGSKIFFHGTNKLWYAGGKVDTWSGKTDHIGYGEDDTKMFKVEKIVDYITGCSLLLKREILEKVGYMEEDYFLYYEETDWNLRVSNKGYLIKYVPTSIVYHKVSNSSGGYKNPSPYVSFYELRNAYMMILRTQKSKLKHFSALLFLYYQTLKKSIKILFLYKNRYAERFFYIAKGLNCALTHKMGKHPNFK